MNIFGSTVLLELRQPSSPSPPLPRPLCRPLTLTILLYHPFHPPPPPPSSPSSTAPTAAAQSAASHINPDTTTDTNPASPDSSNEDQAYTCPHCDRTFTSRIGLVGRLRIHRTETGEPVPRAPTYTHRARLNCPNCPRTFRHRVGLFGHFRFHDDLR
nr:unnamed protein product [Spirometra erinaceieuropaei]